VIDKAPADTGFQPTAITCVAFLRAINVGGRFVKMARLAGCFEQLGCATPVTYLNSGNVIFRPGARALPDLAAALAFGLEPLLGFRTEVFLRSTAEVQTLTAQAASRFPSVPAGGEVNVAFLDSPLTAEQAEQLAGLCTARDELVHAGTEIYWLCHGRQSESKVSNAVLERRLRLRTTIRRLSMLRGLAGPLVARSEI
jgi:uncharacterized protein (DUF1697 family)